MSNVGSCVTAAHGFLWKSCGFGSDRAEMIIVRGSRRKDWPLFPSCVLFFSYNSFFFPLSDCTPPQPPLLRPSSRIKMELSSPARAFFVPLCLSHVTQGGLAGPIRGSLPEQVRSEGLECNVINNVAFKRVELKRPELNFSTFLNLNWFHIYREHVLVLQLGIKPAMGYRFTTNWITRWDQ